MAEKLYYRLRQPFGVMVVDHVAGVWYFYPGVMGYRR